MMREDAARRVGKRGESRRSGSNVVPDPPSFSTKLHRLPTRGLDFSKSSFRGKFFRRELSTHIFSTNRN